MSGDFYARNAENHPKSDVLRARTGPRQIITHYILPKLLPETFPEGIDLLQQYYYVITFIYPNLIGPFYTQRSGEGAHQTKLFPVSPRLRVLSGIVPLSPELAYPCVVVVVELVMVTSVVLTIPWPPLLCCFPLPNSARVGVERSSSPGYMYSESLPSFWKGLLVMARLFMCELLPPPMVTSSVARLPVLVPRDLLPVLPNWLDTFLARGRSVGRHAQITPQAHSTTHHVHAVARVTAFLLEFPADRHPEIVLGHLQVVSFTSNCMMVENRYILAMRTL